jgi:hypothetical protein
MNTRLVGIEVFAILNQALCVLTEQPVTYTEGIKHCKTQLVYITYFIMATCFDLI